MSSSRHIVIDGRIRRTSTGRYVDRLLHYLQRIDSENRYTVLVRPDDDWKPTAKNFSVKKVRYEQFSFNPIDQITFPLVLYKLKPDLVHFTMTQQPLLYFGNIVTTTHDLTMLKYTHKKNHSAFFHWLKDRGYLLLMWAGHRKSKRIIVPTYSVKKQLVAHHKFSLPRIDVTYEAGLLPKVKAPKKPDYVKSNDEFICYVGTAFPHKNGETVVKAFEKLVAKRPHLKMLFVGKTDFFYERLEEYTRGRGRSTNNIIFTGFVSDAELTWILRHAKVYVFATLSEGFGLPGLEAMSQNLPVAASNIPVLKEVLGDAAYYFDPHDPYDIAKKLDTLLGDKQLRRDLAEKGHKQFSKYSWQKMAEETLDIYREALDN